MSKHTRIVGIIAAGLLAAALVSGCTGPSDEQLLVGRWVTELTGYNTVAGGVTKYQQTLNFGDGGEFLFQATLPGAVENAKGIWKLEEVSGEPVISISWETTGLAASQFKYELKGDHLFTSRLSGGMPKPEQLNVQDIDPVEYTRQR